MRIISSGFYNKYQAFTGITMLLALLAGSVSNSEARSRGADGAIEREADCQRDKACVEEYSKQKSQWLKCLDEAGLSEKKRRKLSAKVEGMGIRGMKKQEILIFNSKRKECHNSFLKNLSGIHAKKETVKDDKNPHTTPPPAPDLTKDN